MVFPIKIPSVLLKELALKVSVLLLTTGSLYLIKTRLIEEYLLPEMVNYLKKNGRDMSDDQVNNVLNIIDTICILTILTVLGFTFNKLSFFEQSSSTALAKYIENQVKNNDGRSSQDDYLKLLEFLLNDKKENFYSPKDLLTPEKYEKFLGHKFKGINDLIQNGFGDLDYIKDIKKFENLSKEELTKFFFIFRQLYNKLVTRKLDFVSVPFILQEFQVRHPLSRDFLKKFNLLIELFQLRFENNVMFLKQFFQWEYKDLLTLYLKILNLEGRDLEELLKKYLVNGKKIPYKLWMLLVQLYYLLIAIFFEGRLYYLWGKVVNQVNSLPSQNFSTWRAGYFKIKGKIPFPIVVEKKKNVLKVMKNFVLLNQYFLSLIWKKIIFLKVIRQILPIVFVQFIKLINTF